MLQEKKFVDQNTLQEYSILLAKKVYESDFFARNNGSKNFLVGLWRGGTPIAILVQEFLARMGLEIYHMPIKSETFSGMERGNITEIVGLAHLATKVSSSKAGASKTRILLVDDVWDTGLTIHMIRRGLNALLSEKGKPTMKSAVIFFKPEQNKTDDSPDFYLHETDNWIVFPHELVGLNGKEILEHKPAFAKFLKVEKDEK